MIEKFKMIILLFPKWLIALIVVLILIVFGLGGLLIFGKGKPQIIVKQTNKIENRSEDKPEIISKKDLAPSGKMKLVTENNKNTFKQGETLTLQLIVDSGGYPITGLDAVIKVDPSIVQYEKVQNTLNGYSYFVKNTANQVMYSSNRLFDQLPKVMQETKVMEIAFKTIKDGNATFELIRVPNAIFESNLINSDSIDILDQTEKLVITINK